MTNVRTPPDRRTAAFIADDLRKGIAERRLTPGHKIESEQALCRRFGVCRATVTKALRQLQREGLLVSEHGRGRFVADKPARRRTWTVGLILTNLDYLTHPVVAQALAGAKDPLRDSDYHVKLIAINEANQQHDDWMAVIDPDSLDGAIVMTRMIRMKHMATLAERLPVVWMAGPAVGDIISGVGSDIVGGAFDAVTHLVDLGHRRIDLITIGEGYIQGRDQSVGARLALRAARNNAAIAGSLRGPGPEATPLDLHIHTAHRNRPAEGKRIALDLLSRDDRPTALLCGSDEFAMGVFEAAAELGLDVPRDLSVIAWNDLRAADLPIETTAVAVDTRAHAVAAAEHLIDLIEDRAEPGVMIESPMTLRTRASTAPPQKGDVAHFYGHIPES